MLDNQYPTLAEWILSGAGGVEPRQDDYSDSLVRIFDIGRVNAITRRWRRPWPTRRKL